MTESGAADALSGGRARVRPGPEPGTRVVDSFTGGETYFVDVERGTYSCPGSRMNGAALCKHQAAVLLAKGVSR